MNPSLPSTQSGEVRALSHLPIGTPEGRIDFGYPTANNAKMAVMISNIFGTPAFKKAHYIGLMMEGPMAGSTTIVSPSVFQIYCGEKPVSASGGASGAGAEALSAIGAQGKSNGIAFVAYAENGDMILAAPKGRIRMMAQDIDLVTHGDRSGNGWISLSASGTVKVKGNRVETEGADAIKFGTEREYGISVPGTYKLECGRFKVVEGADASPLGGQAGTLTAKQYAESVVKLIQSALGG
jgi:hypothetical protein